MVSQTFHGSTYQIWGHKSVYLFGGAQKRKQVVAIMKHSVRFCMSCCVRGGGIKSVPSIDQSARWQWWEPSNAHTIGFGGRNVNRHWLLLLPSNTKVSELFRTHCISKQFFGGNFLDWRSCQAEVECSSSTSKGTGNPRNGSEFLPTELLGMRVKWTGTDGLPCLEHILRYCIVHIDTYFRYEDTAKNSKVSLPGVWGLSRCMCWAESAAQTMSSFHFSSVTSDRERIRSWW